MKSFVRLYVSILLLLSLVKLLHSFSPIKFMRRRPQRPWLVTSTSDDASSVDPSSDGTEKSNDPTNTDPTKAFSEIEDYDKGKRLPLTRDTVNVGDPQLKVKEEDLTVTDILRELAAIRQEGPQKYCILGTRHCSYLHQQIIELLAYALILSGNHVFTSGSQGTNAAAVRGALRAEQQDLLTVVLPQSMEKQTQESQELLNKVEDIIAFPEHDDLALEVASKLCNSYILNQTDQLISFAFHESNTVIEAAEEAKEYKKLVTMLFLD